MAQGGGMRATGSENRPTLRGILSDACIELHVRRIYLILNSPQWSDLWLSLGLRELIFRTLGLGENTPDADLWEFCQREGFLLITANRNHEGPDSLEEMIRTRNPPNSLPVLTVADADELLASGKYAERVAERLLDIVLSIDNYRGTGRLWLP
jgi:hypothetical protein